MPEYHFIYPKFLMVIACVFMFVLVDFQSNLLIYANDFNIPARILDVAYSPDGRWLATVGTSGRFQIIDTQSGQIVLQPQLSDQAFLSLSWSSDNNRIALANYDGTIRIYNRLSQSQVLTLQILNTTSPIYDVAWSPDNTRVLATNSSEFTSVVIFDAQSGMLIKSMRFGPINQIAWENNLISVLEWNFGLIRFSDTTNITPSNRLEYISLTEKSGSSFAIGNSNQVAIAGEGSVSVWDISTNTQIISFPAQTEWIPTLQWSPDKTLLAAGSVDGTVKIWNINTMQLVKELTYPDITSVNAIAWNPNGQDLVVAGTKSSIQSTGIEIVPISIIVPTTPSPTPVFCDAKYFR